MITHPKLHYKNKVVCVTGAGGSIGSEICRQLATFEVARIILIARSEIDLFRISRELRSKVPAGTLIEVLGSITDTRLMAHVFETFKPEIVIHAAAHKHVPICEENPVEAVMNNVGGTIALAHEASKWGVEQFVQISTDKAVKPAS